MASQREGQTDELGTANVPESSTDEGGPAMPSLRPYDLVTSSSPVRRAEKTLEFHALDHVAIRVANVRKAESFYHELFQMDVLLRARRLGNTWEPMPADLDWDEGIRTGVYPDLVHLRHGPLSLILLGSGRGSILIDPRLDHISLRVSPGTLATMRAEVLIRSFAVSRDEPRSFQFNDPFGVTWHLTDDDA